MSLKAQPIGPIPEDIAQVVRQALRPTDPLVVIGDRLSTFVSDESFADLYPAEGKPALSPGADGTGSAGPGLAEGGGAQPLGRGVWGLDPARTAGAPQG